MKWIEVVGIRSANSDRKILESNLRKLIDDTKNESNLPVIAVFSRVSIDTDFCVHLYHDSIKVKRGGSRLGLCLVDALKAFGLVNHSIWTEIDCQ